MSSAGIQPSRQAAVEPATSEKGRGRSTAATRRGSGLGKVLVLLTAVVGAGGGVYLYGGPRLMTDLDHTVAYLRRKAQPRTADTPAARHHTPTWIAPSWDGTVTVEADQGKAIGLKLAEVRPQTDPLRLELTGRTAYDPNSLTKVRARWDTLVETVRADLGQLVQKGDPLVDLNSTDLAAAKNDVQAKYVQWQRDLRLLRLDEKLLAGASAVAGQKVIDDQNAENKSRLDYSTARDKLRILGVPDAEIDPLIRSLSDNPTTAAAYGTVADKAKMTLRARVPGIVIQREVVRGNFYDENDVLMVIAELDHLWVLANVYEVDQAKVSVGQKMEIQFPFLQTRAEGTVEYVSSEVSRETRAVQVRASIPNPGGKLKADMLVKAILEIPAQKGQTSIPRQAMVVSNGEEYVFVKRGSATQEPSRFERRKVLVVQENSELVVLGGGVESGELVATGGSLILSQLFEDQQMVETGMPAH
jgi:cobalt-zinc-cadmium efflux system membrane fusion protein